MNTNNTISMLKKQLIGAVAGTLTVLVALSSATYAWYVANNTVKATTNTVSAKQMDLFCRLMMLLLELIMVAARNHWRHFQMEVF